MNLLRKQPPLFYLNNVYIISTSIKRYAEDTPPSQDDTFSWISDCTSYPCFSQYLTILSEFTDNNTNNSHAAGLYKHHRNDSTVCRDK